MGKYLVYRLYTEGMTLRSALFQQVPKPWTVVQQVLNGSELMIYNHLYKPATEEKYKDSVTKNRVRQLSIPDLAEWKGLSDRTSQHALHELCTKQIVQSLRSPARGSNEAAAYLIRCFEDVVRIWRAYDRLKECEHLKP